MRISVLIEAYIMDSLYEQFEVAKLRGEAELAEILREILRDEEKKKALYEKAKIVVFHDEDF